MKSFSVTNRRRSSRFVVTTSIDSAENIQFDYSSFAETNGTVTAVDVTVEYGQAAISGESFASNIKTFVITTSQAGRSLLKLVATSGTDIDVRWLDVWGKDPTLEYSDDYGMSA